MLITLRRSSKKISRISLTSSFRTYINSISCYSCGTSLLLRFDLILNSSNWSCFSKSCYSALVWAANAWFPNSVAFNLSVCKIATSFLSSTIFALKSSQSLVLSSVNKPVSLFIWISFSAQPRSYPSFLAFSKFCVFITSSYLLKEFYADSELSSAFYKSSICKWE